MQKRQLIETSGDAFVLTCYKLESYHLAQSTIRELSSVMLYSSMCAKGPTTVSKGRLVSMVSPPESCGSKM